MKKQNKIVLSLATALILTNSLYAKDVKQLDTVTVTAQKSEENIQDVPISITVFDEFDIADMKIKSVKDIAQYTPNLMLFDNGAGGSFSPTIRGLKTDEGSRSTSVGMYIDGIPMIGTSGFDAILTDIERIEVLKGPQGTLYGRGTESGVINIITKKPDNEIKGKVGLEFGSDNKREYSFGLSGPIVEDKLYIGISGRHYEKDGLIKNTYLGGYTDYKEHNYGKVNLRYTPTDNLDISLISSISKHKDGGANKNFINKPRENANNKELIEPETVLHALKAEYDFDNYKFESITTYKNKKITLQRDYDYTSVMGTHTKYDGDSNIKKNISQEFRLSGDDNKLKWLVGLNADKEDKETSYKLIYNGSTSYTNNTLEGNSYGAFVHTNYALSNALSIIAGLRYDKNDANYKNKNLDLDYSESEISPKLGLEYNLNKDSMVYTTISKGYRPGGFYTFAAQGYSKTFKKETLWSYEVGSKNSFLDNTLIVNGSIYYMSIDDMQVTTNVGNGFDTYKSNAAEATSKGFEFDINYKATDTLKLFASFGYNDIKFDTYKDFKGDYSGKTNSHAPKYNYNIGTQYRSASGYYARVGMNGYGDMYLDKENTFKRDAFSLVNTKIGYETEDYDIYLYADNLFDKEYDSDGVQKNYTIYSPAREIGVQLAYRF